MKLSEEQQWKEINWSIDFFPFRMNRIKALRINRHLWNKILQMKQKSFSSTINIANVWIFRPHRLCLLGVPYNLFLFVDLIDIIYQSLEYPFKKFVDWSIHSILLLLLFFFWFLFGMLKHLLIKKLPFFFFCMWWSLLDSTPVHFNIIVFSFVNRVFEFLSSKTRKNKVT